MARTKHRAAAGRSKRSKPRKYATAAALEKKINAYFKSLEPTDDDPRRRPPTLSGLSVFLDFADFSTFKDYEGDHEYSHTIKKARLKIASAHEERLFAQACTGSIYWLKCNGGDMFKEKPQEHVVNGPLGITLEFVKPNAAPDSDT